MIDDVINERRILDDYNKLNNYNTLFRGSLLSEKKYLNFIEIIISYYNLNCLYPETIVEFYKYDGFNIIKKELEDRMYIF